MVGDRERLLAAGFDGYVGKPIEPEHFGAELDPFLPPPRVVLLVDDDAFMREVLADFLGQQGYAVLAADGAAEALSLMARHAVGVVLCDQCMPVMNGTAFMEHARQLQPDSYRIMLTALADAEPLAHALACGDIDRCLPKPWDGAELRASLRAGFLAHAARVRV
jgi:two-component system cell cycle response regulator